MQYQKGCGGPALWDLGGKHKHSRDWRSLLEAEAQTSCIANFEQDSMSLRFAEMACDCYLPSGTDLHASPGLSEHCHLVANKWYHEELSIVRMEERNRDFESFLVAEELKRTVVKTKLRLAHDAWSTGQVAVSAILIDVIYLEPEVVAVWKKWVALKADKWLDKCGCLLAS